MSYTKDRNAHTRGTGAIAALDGVSSVGRRRQIAGAKMMARQDTRLARLAKTAFRPMAMGRMKAEDPGYDSPIPGNPRTSGGGTGRVDTGTPPTTTAPGPINTGPIINKPPINPSCMFPYGMVNGQCVLVGGFVPPPAPTSGPDPRPFPQPIPMPPVDPENAPPPLTLPPPKPLPYPTGGGGGGNSPPIINDNGGGVIIDPIPDMPPEDTGMSTNTKYLLLGAALLGGYLIWKDSKER